MFLMSLFHLKYTIKSLSHGLEISAVSNLPFEEHLLALCPYNSLPCILALIVSHTHTHSMSYIWQMLVFLPSLGNNYYFVCVPSAYLQCFLNWSQTSELLTHSSSSTQLIRPSLNQLPSLLSFYSYFGQINHPSPPFPGIILFYIWHPDYRNLLLIAWCLLP